MLGDAQTGMGRQAAVATHRALPGEEAVQRLEAGIGTLGELLEGLEARLAAFRGPLMDGSLPMKGLQNATGQPQSAYTEHVSRLGDSVEFLSDRVRGLLNTLEI